MEHFQITCASCNGNWKIDGSCSLYQQQAIESRPCPKCGACTLHCDESQADQIVFQPRQHLAAAS